MTHLISHGRRLSAILKVQLFNLNRTRGSHTTSVGIQPATRQHHSVSTLLIFTFFYQVRTVCDDDIFPIIRFLNILIIFLEHTANSNIIFFFFSDLLNGWRTVNLLYTAMGTESYGIIPHSTILLYCLESYYMSR